MVFAGLTAHSHIYALNTSTNNDKLTEGVERGKRVWEKHACINCHTILGEGAYFAPELGNVFHRYGGRDDAEGAKTAIKEWMKSMPTRIEGRRQMPQFNLSEHANSATSPTSSNGRPRSTPRNGRRTTQAEREKR